MRSLLPVPTAQPTDNWMAEAARDEERTTSIRLRNVLYAADMNLVQAAFEANNMNRVHLLLERYRPRSGEEDPRGFEWYYWQRQCHPELNSVEIPELRRSATTGNWAADGAFNRDGTRLAVGTRGEDGETDEIRIWDSVSGKQELVIPDLHLNAYFPLALSPNGERVAFRVSQGSGGRVPSRYEVKVWDTHGGKEILSIPHGELLAFSPDGKRLGVSILGENRDKPEDGHRVAVWDLENRKELFSRRVSASFSSLVFSPDGSRLAVAVVLRDKSRRTIEASLRIWDAASGKEQKSIALPKDLYDVFPVFSPDSTRLLARCWFISGGSRTAIHAWDSASGNELFALPLRFGRIHNLRFSPDGKLLAIWGSFDPSLDVLDSVSGKKRFTLNGHTHEILSAVFIGDGSRLRTASADGTIRDWTIALPAEKPRRKGSFYPRAISHDGSRIALTPEIRGTKELRVVDRRGKEILSIALPSGSADEAAFSPDGKRLAALWSDDGAKTTSLKMWNTATGAKLLDIPLGENMFESSLVFSPDGSRLAASRSVRDSTHQGDNFTHIIAMWDAGNGKELFVRKWLGIGPDTELAFRPDGVRLAALCTDGTLRIWETLSGREI